MRTKSSSYVHPQCSKEVQRQKAQARSAAILHPLPAQTTTLNFLLSEGSIWSVFSLSLSLLPAHSSIRTNRRSIARLRSRLSKRYACPPSCPPLSQLHSTYHLWSADPFPPILNWVNSNSNHLDHLSLSYASH